MARTPFALMQHCRQALYRAVRSATGAANDAFKPETLIPTPSADNLPRNWWAMDAEALWSSPIVGTIDTTVGMAVEETLRLGQRSLANLNRLGPGVRAARTSRHPSRVAMGGPQGRLGLSPRLHPRPSPRSQSHRARPSSTTRRPHAR